MTDTLKRLEEIEARLKAADADWHIRVCGEGVAEGYDANCSFLENAPADVRYLLSLARAGVELADAASNHLVPPDATDLELNMSPALIGYGGRKILEERLAAFRAAEQEHKP